MQVQDFVKNILQARTKAERQGLLRQVPFHLRDKVKAQVEYQWQRRKKKA